MARPEDTDGLSAVDYWLARLSAMAQLLARDVDRPPAVAEPQLLDRLEGLAHLYRCGLDALAGLLHSVDAGGQTLDAVAVAAGALDRVRRAVYVQQDALAGRVWPSRLPLPEDWRIVAEWPDGQPWQDIAADRTAAVAAMAGQRTELAEVLRIRPDAEDVED